MTKRSALALLALAPLQVLGMAGCARGPEDNGGPGTPQAINRMAVSMTLQNNVRSDYFYAFAFDDDGNNATGPVPILRETSFANGVVGGDFTVLVTYFGGQFTVYRRTRVGNGEDLTRVPNPFAIPPTSPLNTRTLNFTLNLDATYDDNGTERRLFRNAGGDSLPDSLEINFVTTSERRRDPNDQRLKTFDAFYTFSSGTYFRLTSLGSRTVDNQTSGVRESAEDVFQGDDARNVNEGQLDITDFRITIQRS